MFCAVTEVRTSSVAQASTLRPSPLAPRPSPLIFWTSLGFAIAAVQLLPSWEALGESSRHAVDASFRNWGSLHPLNLVQFVAPYLFSNRVVGQNTHEYGCYAGSVTLLLAVWCVVGQKQSGRLRPLILGAAATAILGMVFALGGFGPLENLTAWLPVVNRFRFPCRVIVLVQFALAVLAAIGLAKIGRSTAANRAGLRAVWLLFGLSVALAIGGPILWPGFIGKAPIVAAAAARLGGAAIDRCAALLVTWAVRRESLGTVRTRAVGGHRFRNLRDELCRPFANDALVRIRRYDGCAAGAVRQRIAVDLAEPNQPFVHLGDRLLLSGWSFADGYAGLEPARRLDYREPAAFRVAGVGWAINNPELAHRLRLAPSDSSWLPLNDCLPRTKLFSRGTATADPCATSAKSTRH